MGGKKKNKDKKNNIDVVEQVQKEKNKGEEKQTQQADSVKEGNEETGGQKLQETQPAQTTPENTQQTHQSNKVPADKNQIIVPESVTNNQMAEQIISEATQPHEETKYEQVQKTGEKVIEVSNAEMEKKAEEQPKQSLNEVSAPISVSLQRPESIQVKIGAEVAHIEPAQIQSFHSQPVNIQHGHTQVKNIQPVVHGQPAQNEPIRHWNVATQPANVHQTGTYGVRPQQKQFVTPLIPHQQQKFGEQNQDLPYRHELMDGLNLIAKIDEEILKYPLQHEQDAHGPPKFTQNFNTAAYNYNQIGLQQVKQPGVSSQRQQQQLLKDKRIQDREALQQIKQSAESLEPDPLDVVDTEQKVNILKSYHSESAQQEKKKSPASEKNQDKSSEKEKIQRNIQQQVIRRNSIDNQSRRSSTDHKHPDVPAFPLENPSQNSIQSAKKLDHEEINQRILKKREEQWKKMQERDLEPKRPSFIYVHPQPQTKITTDPVRPHVAQHLGYTNNLPLINQQKEVRKKSMEMEQNMVNRPWKKQQNEEKEQIKKQKQQIKQKLQQNQKLAQDVNKDNSLRKLSIAALVTAACFGACILGKVDKRIAGGATVASFIVSYLAQK